jgi:fatty-acyl-CoA synthase
VSAPATIPQVLLATAEKGRGEYVFHLEDGPSVLGCAELAERAKRGARRLLARGVRPGDTVGVLGPNRPEWAVWAFATWMAGAVLAPVQIPLRIRDPAAFGEQLSRLVDAARCRCVLAAPELASLLGEDGIVAWREEGEESDVALPEPAADDPAVVQFTSGSTAAPKGALLTHRAVRAQIEILRRAYLRADGTPVETVSWAPFFHDLGLFPNLVQVAFTGARSHQLPTERFARDPAEWLRLVERTRASLTVAPSAAFGSALRAASRRDERIDLGSLDVAYMTAEGVDPDVARRMLGAAESFGLRPEALGVAYGLAEAGAVSFPHVGTGMRVDRVDLDELAGAGVAIPAAEDAGRPVASCGPPLVEVRIADPGDIPLEEGCVGEIQVWGEALMSGYVGRDVPQPIVDGWLHTGDLGYMRDGELFVTGRAKDMVIAMGHNYYPEDFEWAAARAGGVRPGRCVAFNLPGTEDVVVLVEAADPDSAAGLERAVSREVHDAVGLRPSAVVVLPPGAVEKTTSGKLRRAAMRQAYASGALATPA